MLAKSGFGSKMLIPDAANSFRSDLFRIHKTAGKMAKLAKMASRYGTGRYLPAGGTYGIGRYLPIVERCRHMVRTW